jgi:pyruvate-ferredoxin/flavodoxin oxidoreductase
MRLARAAAMTPIDLKSGRAAGTALLGRAEEAARADRAPRAAMLDGNEAAASVAYRLSEVVAIYPITPSSPMGELADEWAARGRRNVFGAVPRICQMQSEGGAAGAVHGALQAGALTTTFTASQGLLLMIPNMYKIAGELTPAVIHVAARTLATHALSIFGDHSDVYACRQTGFAMLCSGSVQEAHDMAAIAHSATLASRIPFLHFFDGFRTSHEIAKIDTIGDDALRTLVGDEAVRAHRERALTPEKPFVRGTAQNPDTFFQAREAITPYYAACPGLVERAMERFAALTGRRYRLFDVVGHPDAERVIVAMGSAGETAHEVVEAMAARGERVALVKVRLYRPFDAEGFAAALPATTRAIAVLDRTKEPGAPGEPLYLDVVAALAQARARGRARPEREPLVVGGRYGLASKEFSPAMVRAVLAELSAPSPKDHFTVGIVDDVSGTSLAVDPAPDPEPDDVFRAVFYGLGSDGTVSANKSSIKILGEEAGRHAQGYFVYDSKKAGAITVSHLRFGPRPIRSTYLIRAANFVACHQWAFLERMDVLECAVPGAVFLLNAPYPPERVWEHLPRDVQAAIVEKKLKLHVIDADAVAKAAGMGRRINTIMQTAFFAISGVLDRDDAIARIKAAVRKTYGAKGQEIVRLNDEAVDATLARLHRVEPPALFAPGSLRPNTVPAGAPDFVKRVTSLIIEGKGDLLPVSAFPPDGTWPSGTAKWEKRNIALEIPVWDPSICIQCNKCALVCPHAAIRAKVYPADALAAAPAAFLSRDFKGDEFAGMKYTIQVAPEDCTGCTLCVHVCPAKDRSNPRHKALDMAEQRPIRERERESYAFFLDLPEVRRDSVKLDVKGTQFLEPLFEYSGACPGCGETPYVKLLTQLFGDRALIANATGCSSIYGGNLPTTPFSVNREGRGPAWSNSLFEDNAEFGLGFRLALDASAESARRLLGGLAAQVGEALAGEILDAPQRDEAGIAAQRARVLALRERLAALDAPDARRLDAVADALVRKSVWIVGGDGWAYDIGYGGLDHVLALGRDVNVLVLDTGVYSNTGGQASKATPMGAVAKFAIAGKDSPRKDLALMAMAYRNVYVAQVAFGAKDTQTVKAFVEAESYPGPSLIIAHSTCIAHGYDLADGLDHMKLAVDTGFWPLFRYDPRRAAEGENPLSIDSKPPGVPLEKYTLTEARFRMLQSAAPERAKRLQQAASADVSDRFRLYRHLAEMRVADGGAPATE